MLQMGCLLDEQEQLQVISSLRCTATGREVYDLLKQELSSLNQKSGPKSFTLAPNSTVSYHFFSNLFSVFCCSYKYLVCRLLLYECKFEYEAVFTPSTCTIRLDPCYLFTWSVTDFVTQSFKYVL